MSSLVIGRGEVGTALAEVLECQSYDITDEESYVNLAEIDVLHIAFPWSNEFVTNVLGYQELVTPDLTIIYSTVPIGTSEELGAVHSPIEGQHPDLADYIRRGVRWLGSSNPSRLFQAYEFWMNRGPIIQQVKSADWTEFLKLRSTARYGVNIAFANYEYRVAEEIGMPARYLQDFDLDYNRLYKGDRKANRYVLRDPKGEIGGHCVVPNAKILYGQYPDHMLVKIIEMEADE